MLFLSLLGILSTRRRPFRTPMTFDPGRGPLMDVPQSFFRGSTVCSVCSLRLDKPARLHWVTQAVEPSYGGPRFGLANSSNERPSFQRKHHWRHVFIESNLNIVCIICVYIYIYLRHRKTFIYWKYQKNRQIKKETKKYKTKQKIKI